MNYWNRMVNSVWAGKRKTIVILFIAIVLSFILLVAISIRNASMDSVKKIRSSIETSVNVLTNNSYAVNPQESNKIALSKVRQMEKLGNVKSSNFYARSVGYAQGFTPIIMEEQKKAREQKLKEAKDRKDKHPFVEAFNVSLEGNRATKYNRKFVSQENKMVFGRQIQEEDQHVCLMYYKLASDNNLSLGSTIAVKGPTGKSVKLKLIGVYATSFYYYQGIYDPYQNQENLIYTDLASAMEVNDDDMVSMAEFKMKDPEDNKQFVQQVLNIDKENKDEYIFSFNDTSYRLLSSSLKIMITIANLVLIGATFLGGIILTLLVAISMRDRDYEIGILLAMGERKYKIMIQMIGEVLLPILVGASIGVVISLGLSGVVNHMVEGTAGIKASTSIVTVLEMIGGILLVNLIGAIVTIYKVVRYQPKEILMHLE